MTVMTRLRPFTTKVFNPVFRHVAAWAPGCAILQYVGRKSGRVYRTPVIRFRHGQGYVLCLVYGSDVQWVKNVRAAGGASLRIRRRTVRLVDPEVVVDPTRRLLPWYARPLMRVLRVKEFMTLRAADTPDAGRRFGTHL
jgi:deazaflavin-dependent oxidoreductase (nitroreductase family)